jgi:hypothetical protein
MDKLATIFLFVINLELGVILTVTINGKAIPLQTRTGPQGYRRLRLPDFKTIDT